MLRLLWLHHVRVTARIILLNGPSSAGKSSIAAELLDLLDPPHFAVPVDAVNAMRSRQATARLAEDEVADVLERTVLGYHRVLAGLAAAGNPVLADHVLRPHWLDDCLAVLRAVEVVFVGVRCPLPELRRREAARGDRTAGQAERQIAYVHAHNDYDVECDTSVLSPRECALRIRDHLAKPCGERAFDRLRAARSV